MCGTGVSRGEPSRSPRSDDGNRGEDRGHHDKNRNDEGHRHGRLITESRTAAVDDVEDPRQTARYPFGEMLGSSDLADTATTCSAAEDLNVLKQLLEGPRLS